MAVHRHESYELSPPSHRRILAILVFSGMLTIGFIGAVFTASYLMGGIFAILTGAIIVLAHLMIAPRTIFERTSSDGS